MRKHRLAGGTHRDSAVSAGAVKVGVLGVLATATIAAPLAAAAAGIDETAPQGETIAQAQPQPAAPAAQAPAPVALPSAEVAAEAAVEARTDDADASRAETRTSPVSEEAEASED
ncbi:MAG: M23 family peptidase, partial [Dermabacteraceae bacterium]